DARRQKPPERRRNGRHGTRDRREELIVLPAAAKRFVERHELRRGTFLRGHILQLYFVFLALRVDDIERIRQSPIEPLGGKAHRAPCRRQCVGEMAQASLLRRISVDGGIHLADRVEYRLLIVEQELAGAKIGLLHNRIEPAEIQYGRRNRRPDRPYRADGKGRDAGLPSAGSDRRHLREKVRGDSADKGGGARQLAFGFGNVGTAPQQLDRQAGADTARQRRKHPRLCQLLAEVFGKFSDQDGDDVAGGVDLRLQGRKLRLQLRQFTLGQCHVQLIGDAAAEALPDEIDVLLRHHDILAQYHELHLQRP